MGKTDSARYLGIAILTKNFIMQVSDVSTKSDLTLVAT